MPKTCSGLDFTWCSREMVVMISVPDQQNVAENYDVSWVVMTFSWSSGVMTQSHGGIVQNKTSSDYFHGKVTCLKTSVTPHTCSVLVITNESQDAKHVHTANHENHETHEIRWWLFCKQHFLYTLQILIFLITTTKTMVSTRSCDDARPTNWSCA